jgi:DUF1680 family protein
MTPRLIASNPLVRENTRRVAVERGPLVYAMEGLDQKGFDSLFDAALSLPSKGFSLEHRPEFLGGVTVLRHAGVAAEPPLASLPLYQPLDQAAVRRTRKVELVLIPYYTFHNRGPTPMQVWIPYEQ